MQWIWFGISVAGGILTGYLLKWFLLPWVVRISHKTRWKSDDIIIQNAKTWVVFWFFLAGLSFGIRFLTLTAKYENYIDKAILAALIFSLTWFLARIIAQLIELRAEMDGSSLRSTSIITNIVKIVVYVIGLLFLMQALGISITPLITALGVGGLAVALALQEPLTNLFAGIQVIAAGKIRAGDYIQLDSGEEGWVEDIAWRSTSIRTLPNHIVIVPNNKLAGAIVKNFALPEPELGCVINLGVSYDSDLEKVERVTIEVAREVLTQVEGGVPGFNPFIRYNSFSDSSIDFAVILRAKQFTDQFLLRHEFIKRLQRRYKMENIEIPFPIRTVYMKQ